MSLTPYCCISGYTPSAVNYLDNELKEYSYHLGHPVSPLVESAVKALADTHELTWQGDLTVVGPMDPSGKPCASEDEPDADDPDPEINTNIRVLPHCVMSDVNWSHGCVGGPPPNKERLKYDVALGSFLMVQTYALDIMALATQGRMTPLRLWRIAIKERIEAIIGSYSLNGVDYGEMTEMTGAEDPEPLPKFATLQLLELEKVGDVEVIKQRLVHEGPFWVWMAPDRFPISPTKLDDPAPVLSKVHPRANHSVMETLSSEVLIPIVSLLPLTPLVNLASTSWSLRIGIFGNDYLASIWIHKSAPWWIPMPTQTPKKDGNPNMPTPHPPACLASQWSAETHTTLNFPAGLGWGYIKRCARSGSMRNRRRIWNTAVDIERVADLAGM